MSAWRDRLALLTAEKMQECPNRELTKPTEPRFVSFGSEQDDPFGDFSVASAQDWAKAQTHGGSRKQDQSATLHLDTASKRAAESGASVRTQKMGDKVAKADPELEQRLIGIAVAHGLDPALVAGIPDDELGAYGGQSDQVIVASLRVLHDQRLMATGTVPDGWTEPIQCRGCGPVYLWPGCPSHVIACPWCRQRKAGIAIPTPPPVTPPQE